MVNLAGIEEVNKGGGETEESDILDSIIEEAEKNAKGDEERDIEEEKVDKEVLEEEEGEEEGEEKEIKEGLKDKEEKKEKRLFLSTLWDLAKDVIIALIIVIIIISSIYIYTGNWPPVVVVESDSMQHSDDESFLGVIDTGDLVLVKSIESEKDVITYMKGKRIDHETYSEYGDVLIYRKNGYSDTTPVIHRALIWLEYNETSNSFDVPELKHHETPDEWEVLGGANRWYNITGILLLKDIGYDNEDVRIDLNNIFNTYAIQGVEPHSGFVTLGDHNLGNYDQNMLPDDHGARVRPVRPDWVVGKGRGELPWFGLIKLWFSEETRDEAEGAPSNSWTMLFITLVLIIAVPIAIDILLILYERKKAKREEEKEAEEKESEKKIREEEPLPFGEALEEEEEPPPPEDLEEEEEPPPPEDLEEEEEPPPPED
ncbi:MAG: S26 family signal peptidase [Thermoplasmata archaeon]|nr:MAG: S26 family signal peptidase [Thermoplasmata archaeon]